MPGQGEIANFHPFQLFFISDSLHYKVMCRYSFVILLMLCCRIPLCIASCNEVQLRSVS